MFWFCGGHGQCAEGNGGEPGAGLDVGSILGSGGGDPRLEAASAAWLARYLKGDESVDTGPGFEFRSDDGTYRVAPRYPVLPGKTVKGRGSGTLAISPGATSGGATSASAAATGAVNVPVTVRRAGQLLGPPKVTITYTGTGTPGTPGTTRIFAQLVNLDRGVVVGNQSAPIPVRLDGRRHTISRRLVPIASTARAGARYQLQLVAGSAIWARQRATGTLNAARISVELPVASRAGLGRRGKRCSTARRFGVVLPRGLRRQIVGGRVVYRGKRVARFRAGGKGGRFRFPAAAQGKQRLRLVLKLADGRTVKRTGTAWLCGAAF
jgi:ABC-2 type transport system ATP-binding protein